VKKMRKLTALMVVGAIVLGAILLVPMSLAANGTASGHDVANANGDSAMDKSQVKDQAKDGSCDGCDGDQDMLMQQNRTRAQDGSCDGCDGDQDMLMQQNRTRAQDGSCDGCVCVDGTCDPACDQVRERLQSQDGGNCGECNQMQNLDQVSIQLQDRTCTRTQSCMGKA